MTHTATKVRPGHYTYRGYKIENMQMWDNDCKFWNVTAPGDDDACASENTLRSCKNLIDFFEK